MKREQEYILQQLVVQSGYVEIWQVFGIQVAIEGRHCERTHFPSVMQARKSPLRAGFAPKI